MLILWVGDNCNKNAIEIPARCYTCEHEQNFDNETLSFGDTRCYDPSKYLRYYNKEKLDYVIFEA